MIDMAYMYYINFDKQSFLYVVLLWRLAMQLGKYSGDVSRLGERGPGATDKKMQNL